jgi:hypothetical protein
LEIKFGAFVMVAHQLHEIGQAEFPVWPNPERQRFRGVVALDPFAGKVQRRGHSAKHAPNASFAKPQPSKGEGVISIGKAEFLILACEVTLLAGKRNYVRGIEAIGRIIQRESAKA